MGSSRNRGPPSASRDEDPYWDSEDPPKPRRKPPCTYSVLFIIKTFINHHLIVYPSWSLTQLACRAIRLISNILQVGHLSNESKCKSQIRAHFEINTLRSRRHLTKWMLEHQQSVDETLANSRPVPPMRRAYSADEKSKIRRWKEKIRCCEEQNPPVYSWKTIMITRRAILYTFIYIYSAVRKSKSAARRINFSWGSRFNT